MTIFMLLKEHRILLQLKKNVYLYFRNTAEVQFYCIPVKIMYGSRRVCSMRSCKRHKLNVLNIEVICEYHQIERGTILDAAKCTLSAA